jgi:hypothetical protein
MRAGAATVRGVTDALFDAAAPAAGPFRRLLEARVVELDAAELDPVVLELVRYLADRVDRANAGRYDRGFVILAAEVRAAYRDLTGPGEVAADDSFERALADFRAAEAGHPTAPGPAD